MSAGDFVNTKYEASYASSTIHPIRLQTETPAATFYDILGGNGSANVAPSGNINNPISALTSLTRNKRGLRPRYIVGEWEDTKPTGYTGDTIKLVILSIAVFNALTVGAKGNYLGQDFVIVAKEPERAR